MLSPLDSDMLSVNLDKPSMRRGKSKTKGTKKSGGKKKKATSSKSPRQNYISSDDIHNSSVQTKGSQKSVSKSKRKTSSKR